MLTPIFERQQDCCVMDPPNGRKDRATGHDAGELSLFDR
jgi:hypothetical protein